MKGIKNENDGKKSLHGIWRNGIRRNGKTPDTQTQHTGYIALAWRHMVKTKNITLTKRETSHKPWTLDVVILPTRHLAYWTVRLLDISPTTWAVRLQIALHFTNKTTAVK